MQTYHLTVPGRLVDAQGHDTGVHGLLHLYTRDKAGRWWEYEAKFTDGQLQRLVPRSAAQYGESGLRLQPSD